MAYRLIDTNIVSYFMKRHTLAALYRPHIAGYDVAISFQTFAELHSGGRLANWSQKRWNELERTLTNYEILHSNETICVWFAEIRAVRKSQPIGLADCWIAATAFTYDLELVTHNPADFTGIPWLKIITEAP
jgi:predicted nucleic acid-binding protein